MDRENVEFEQQAASLARSGGKGEGVGVLYISSELQYYQFQANDLEPLVLLAVLAVASLVCYNRQSLSSIRSRDQLLYFYP